MSTDRKTRAETAAETAERLVAVAAQALRRQGAGLSLDALAAEAGVTRGALHHHFRNRAGLVEAVLRRELAVLTAALDAQWAAEIAAGDDGWDAFRRYAHRYLDAVVAPGRGRLIFQDAPAVLGDVAWDIIMEEGFAAMVADLRRLQAQGRVVAVEAEALGHALNGAYVALAYWAADATAGPARRAAAHAALEALLDGLTQQGGRGRADHGRVDAAG